VTVTSFDSNGTPHVLDSSDYDVTRGEEPAVLALAPHFDMSLASNGFEIDLTAGFGDLGTDVPDTLKRAVLLLCAHWYEFRGAIPPSQQPVSLPPGFEALMQPYRRVRL
ncbi:MAG: head-tail connector protein, partial [Pseudomonadota bacterium]